MATNILQQAIVDAKRIKSAALANAKIALEETFQPTLQRMISTKLSEEDDEFSDDPEIEIEVNPEDDGSDMGADPSMGAEDEPVGFSGDDSAEGVPPTDDTEEVPPTDDEEMPTEEQLELEALIRELEDGSDCEDDDLMGEGEEEQWRSTNPSSERDQFSEGDDFDMADDDMVESVLEALLGEEDGLGDALDSGKNNEDGTAFTDSPTSGPQFLENRKLRKENAKLKADIQEALRTITTYKQAINEVNLLNAKLMFTTKTLRQFELSENQQVKILESFDRANSVREVKLVYTTIVESFNKKGKPAIKENKGLASKSIKQINPKSASKVSNSGIISESTVTRLQQLAGLKKIDG